MEEIFKDIEGSNEIYQVSNLGRVKSYNQNKDGKIFNPIACSNGYQMVRLRGSIQKICLIHRLVAKAFLPNPENKKEINHINGIKTDNRLENLEWATRTENMRHAFKTGLAKGHSRKGKKGEDNPRSMPVIQSTLDGKFIAKYPAGIEAARQLGCNAGSISNCCNGKTKMAYGFKWQYKI